MSDGKASKKPARVGGRRASARPTGLGQLGAGFRALYHSAPCGMATLSSDGAFLRANAALCRFLGYTPDELESRTFNEVTFPEDIPACDALFGRIQRGEIDHFTMEKRYVRKDGKLVWAHVIVVAVRDGSQLLHTIGVAVDITERKRAEQALKESEEHYRGLYNRAPVMMHSIDPAGRLLSVSDAWLSALGYEREEVIGRPLVDFLDAESRSRATSVVLPRLFSVGQVRDIPYTMMKKDGGRIETLLSAAIEWAADGRPLRTLAAIRDVTEWRRAERELKTSEERHRRLYERAPACMHFTDPNGAITTVTDSWLELLGRRREEVVGRPCTDFLKPARGAVSAALSALFETGSCYHVPYIAKTADDRELKVVVSAVALRDDGSGRLLGYMVSITDVTARSQAEEQLRRMHAELEETVRERTQELEWRNALLTAQTNASLNGVLVVDEHERIILYNRRFVELWGVPPDIMALASDKKALEFALGQLTQPEEFLARVRYLYDHKDETSLDQLSLTGERTFERYSGPVVSPSGQYYGRYWEFRDISRPVRAEKRLEERTRALARSNAELEIYAAAASHDLVAPLRKIIAFGELLSRRAEHCLGAEDLQLLQRIRANSARMARLIDDVLTLARVDRQALPLEEVDLGALTRDVLSDLDATISASHASVDVGPLPVIRGHASLLRRLLQNLIANALKFTRPGEAPRVRVDSFPAQGGVSIAVSDHGIGFRDGQAETIFRPFHRLEPSKFEGSGLGLAICQRIAARYGGWMSAHGRPGQGSTFLLWLPDSAIARPAGER